MNAILTRLSGLPGPARAVLLVACGGGLLGAAYLMFPQYIWIIVIGMIAMSIAVGMFAMFSKWRAKKKAAPMEKDLMGNTSARPGGMSNPDHIAKLDDLRKQFQSGLEKFRAAGKNLYSLPWYALVGEPGSGKTEAIRHCQVGFPPGLQDQYQGAGGTLNMNWWFTNHAVIIDTAGRLMFEDVQPGQTSEWTEFLKMLRTHRPNCPINGMLLVIPADTLIKDDANEIERKASKIAQQLDNIQRQLGVRFPVFVVVTKCDLITGFREFFRHIDDPEGQAQVLGWSNPNELDEVFDPHQVDRYLDEVRKRMLKRRMALLLEEGHSDRPEDKRLEKVDSLFAFPEALSKISPRLKRYLEMVFVAGEWSQKPLFLRGIYFTSAMEEGGALDQDLAEALGVDVASLSQEGVFRRERSVFLRDMFLRKVFQERGLVTRATNTKQMQRRRRTITMTASIAAVLIMITVTWFSASSLENSIGKHTQFWTAAERELVTDPDVTPEILDTREQPFAYAGVNEIPGDGLNTTIGEFPALARKDVEQPISVPLIFKPVSWFSDLLSTDLDQGRKSALRAMFASIYLEPLTDAARTKMQTTEAPQWDQTRTEALEQLMLIEADRARPDDLVHGSAVRHIELKPLFRAALDGQTNEQQLNAYEDDVEALTDVFDWLYRTRSEGRQWPPDSLVGRKNQKAIDAGVESFIRKWGQTQADSTSKLGKLIALRDAIEAFKSAEDDLLKFRDQYPNEQADPTTLVQHNQVVELWNRRLEKVTKAQGMLQSAVDAIGADMSKSVATLTAEAEAEVKQTLLPRFHDLINAARSYEKPVGGAGKAPADDSPDADPAPDEAADDPAAEAADAEPADEDAAKPDIEATDTTRFLDATADRLEAAAEALEKQTRADIDALRKVLSDYESDYLAKADSAQRGYAARAAIYNRANEELTTREQLSDVVALTDATQAMQKSLSQAQMDFEAVARRAPNSKPYQDALHVGNFILRVAEGYRNYDLYKQALDKFPDKAEAVAQWVKQGVPGAQPWPTRVIPGTSFQQPDVYDGRYQPEAAGRLLAALNQISDAINSDNVSVRVIERDELVTGFANAELPLKQYAEDYVKYWARDVRDLGNVRNFTDWPTFHQSLTAVQAFQINSQLQRLNEDVSKALKQVPQAFTSKAAAEMIAEENQAQAMEAPNLNNPRFDNLCQSTVTSWQALGGDADSAIRAVQSSTGLQLRDQRLQPYPLGVRYWRSFCLQGLTRLADAGHTRALEAVSQIARQGKAFPLCLLNNPGARPPLDKKTVQDIRQQVAQISAQSGSAAAADPINARIGQGGKVGYEELDALLLKMNGGEALADEKTRTWFKKVAALCEALVNPEQPQTMTIRAPQFNVQNKVPQVRGGGAAGDPLIRFYRKFGVELGGQKIGRELNTDMPTPEGLDNVPSLQLPSSQSTHLLLYSQVGDERHAQKAPFESAWSLLEAVQQATPEPGDDGKVWLVPVIVERHDQPGAKVYWWVELQFARPLPPFKDWPREADWPPGN